MVQTAPCNLFQNSGFSNFSNTNTHSHTHIHRYCVIKSEAFLYLLCVFASVHNSGYNLYEDSCNNEVYICYNKGFFLLIFEKKYLYQINVLQFKRALHGRWFMNIFFSKTISWTIKIIAENVAYFQRYYADQSGM